MIAELFVDCDDDDETSVPMGGTDICSFVFSEDFEMDMCQFFGGSYLAAHDIQRPIVVTIAKFDITKVNDQRKGLVDKIALSFQGCSKAMLLNKTNAVSIATALGSSDMRNWIGRQIELYTEIQHYPSPNTPALRVRVSQQQQPQQQFAFAQQAVVPQQEQIAAFGGFQHSAPPVQQPFVPPSVPQQQQPAAQQYSEPIAPVAAPQLGSDDIPF